MQESIAPYLHLPSLPEKRPPLSLPNLLMVLVGLVGVQPTAR